MEAEGAPSTGALPDAGAKVTVEEDDLKELMRLQQKNCELKGELDSISRKIQQLRKATGNGKMTIAAAASLRQSMGMSTQVQDHKPPPEYFDLKKELREKQEAVRGLRKRWWMDHKDLESIVGKQAAQAAHPSQANRRDSVLSGERGADGPPSWVNVLARGSASGSPSSPGQDGGRPRGGQLQQGSGRPAPGRRNSILQINSYQGGTAHSGGSHGGAHRPSNQDLSHVFDMPLCVSAFGMQRKQHRTVVSPHSSVVSPTAHHTRVRHSLLYGLSSQTLSESGKRKAQSLTDLFTPGEGTGGEESGTESEAD